MARQVHPGKTADGVPVVAELGRPETAQETADRKAASSRTHRENQTSLNLIAALLVSLAVVAVIVVMVVRPDPEPREPVDYDTIASQLQPGFETTIVSPTLPPGWEANSARTEKGADGVASWYIGFVTPGSEFVAMTQGIDANPTWLAAQLDGARMTGSETVDGVRWDVYDQRGAEDVGNLEYVMTATFPGEATGSTPEESTMVLYGSASPEQFRTLAAAVAAELPTPSG
ncbi:uncharacterized protein DUF4245 [Homoserinimonas aerilata]|uniref:Uncharacterized protein DUF4245 n=1 Tax=Homoserinimonas aerilata TaxID=1162970 RepID=A0A542YGU0_9MICO|nr:DUF4245 domain-containing protein [Homoserinimonas aerilata]TQL47297.1 uncharacterized protein DUF4245 [Homoserinimonas aerilata]